MDTRPVIAGLAAVAAAAAALPAQTYRDLTFVRDLPSPWATVFQVRAGVLAGFASSENEAIGLEDEVGWDGHVWFHTDEFTDRRAALDAYAGRDGAYFGVVEGELLGQETQSRLELSMRYFPFYREGFYRDDDFIPTGQYKGLDYGVSLSVAREVQENTRLEVGPFYRRMTFDRSDDTRSDYVIPDDYNAFGGRLFLEYNTVVIDRSTGRADHGVLATLGVESEFNDSNRTFGRVGVFESRLPSRVWRGLGHVEVYLPQSQATTWEIQLDGAITDNEDRVFSFDAQKPVGHIWVDGEIGLRIDLGLSLWVTPYAKAQFVKVLEENGVSNEKEMFYGGGLAAGFDAADNIGLRLDYSYLTNQSRPPVSSSNDTFGEHQLFVGIEARFGARRR